MWQKIQPDEHHEHPVGIGGNPALVNVGRSGSGRSSNKRLISLLVSKCKTSVKEKFTKLKNLTLFFASIDNNQIKPTFEPQC